MKSNALRICITSFLLLFTVFCFAQSAIPVRGKVSNASGEPLPGVTVQVKNGSASTTTNAEGSFQINVPSQNTVLVFSYVGMGETAVSVGSKRQIDVSMTPAVNSLQDVVVVGYGSQKKSDVTGALTSISAKTIEERPVTNAMQAIQGKAAGVNVSTNMKPGETPRVSIRGNRSINASNDPLYVVDGIPIVSALGVSSFSINDINPNDIASMEILKDASATAIYGSRGANGVVLITTKKGTKGRVSVNYNATISLDSYKSLTQWMNAGQYVDAWRQALINGRSYQSDNTNSDLNIAPKAWYADPDLDRKQMTGITSDPVALESIMMGYEWNPDGSVKRRPTTPEEQALGWGTSIPVYNSANIRNYDWRDAVTRQGVTQNHQISISTGSELSRLYMSLGYNNQLGVQRDQNFKRFNVNLNGEINANKWLTLGTSMIASLSEQNYGVSANNSNTGSKDLYSRANDQYPYALPTRFDRGLY